ncbi:MAG: hypothetical protein H7Z19_04640 [Chitinophagaceae bacterium]|nr:hypothetical protein [Rubrivivax sp.]
MTNLLALDQGTSSSRSIVFDQGLFTLLEGVALQPQSPQTRRKSEPGWTPGEDLQR